MYNLLAGMSSCFGKSIYKITEKNFFIKLPKKKKSFYILIIFQVNT